MFGVVFFCLCVFFFFKQKTAYEMRISDWSSDVCSSDLNAVIEKLDRHAQHAGDLIKAARADAIGAFFVFLNLLKGQPEAVAELFLAHAHEHTPHPHAATDMNEIGRASCRERVCQYV